MATSKCPSCSSTGFEAHLAEHVSDYKFKLNFIQCSKCGAVVGVVPFYDPGMVAHKNEKQLEELKTAIAALERKIENLRR